MYGGNVIRTPVGQAYISEGMIEFNGVIGGEGSGGVTVPELHSTHDSAAAVGLILEGLARAGTLSQNSYTLCQLWRC